MTILSYCNSNDAMIADRKSDCLDTSACNIISTSGFLRECGIPGPKLKVIDFGASDMTRTFDQCLCFECRTLELTTQCCNLLVHFKDVGETGSSNISTF